MAKTLSPLADRVVVRPAKAEQVSRGGIMLPTNVRRKVCRGVVEAVGPGRRDKDGRRQPLDVKQGDVVVYVEFAGSQVEEEGPGSDTLVLMREDEILAVEV